ncbi:MAG: hypothetical protein R3E46_17675 [Sedimenticolaceae bacterium]
MMWHLPVLGFLRVDGVVRMDLALLQLQHDVGKIEQGLAGPAVPYPRL